MTSLDDRTEADQDLAEAQQLVDDLEERVRAGDESVDASEVIKAQERLEGLRRFAALRVEAAERRAEQAAQARRREQHQELLDRIDRMRVDDADLGALIDAAADALQAVEAAARKRWDEAVALHELAKSIPGAEEFSVWPGGVNATSTYAVKTPAGSVRALDPKLLIRLAIHEALGESVNRIETDLRHYPSHAAAELGRVQS